MRSPVWLVTLALAACADDPATGAASSTAHPGVRSAYVVVRNVELLEPPGLYRRWEVLLVEDPPATPCPRVGDTVVQLAVYTIFSSAPRGMFALATSAQPPRLFPSAYGTVSNGLNVQGTLSITSAATTGVTGSLDGQFATSDGAIHELDVEFDAPTCDA